MTASLALALALAAAAPSPPPPPRLGVVGPIHDGETRCALCHTAEGWRQVSFSHDRTGFPLTGRHRDVTCQACHPAGDFTRAVPRACAACHRDVHAGRMGARCDRCHATSSWKEASFGPEAHRRTAFPLTGRHAVLPCEACHDDRRDRTFSRPASRCVDCHQADYDRTALDPGLIAHAAAGFSTDCRGCHGAWRFSPGLFPEHERCFSIRGGPHAGIRCKDCHGPVLPTLTPGQPLTCSSTPPGAPPADCMRCHPPAAHPNVPGFFASNSRCYECHRFAAPTGRLPGGLR